MRCSGRSAGQPADREADGVLSGHESSALRVRFFKKMNRQEWHRQVDNSQKLAIVEEPACLEQTAIGISDEKNIHLSPAD
jgi:hypothetical protein